MFYISKLNFVTIVTTVVASATTVVSFRRIKTNKQCFGQNKYIWRK